MQQMLDVVKDTWYDLAGGEDPPSIDIHTIANFLADVWKVSDRAYALKYIHHCVQSPTTQELDWDDFNQLFCRGIFMSSLTNSID